MRYFGECFTTNIIIDWDEGEKNKFIFSTSQRFVLLKKIEGGGWKTEGGGWRMENGGWRSSWQGVLTCSRGAIFS